MDFGSGNAEESKGFGMFKFRHEQEEPDEREEDIREPTKLTPPTLHGATFKPLRAFKVEDYVHQGESEGLKRHIIKTGKSWKVMVGFTFEISCNNKKWTVTKRRNEFGELNKDLHEELESDGQQFPVEFPGFKDQKDETDESREESLRQCVNWLQTLSETATVKDNQLFLEF